MGKIIIILLLFIVYIGGIFLLSKIAELNTLNKELKKEINFIKDFINHNKKNKYEKD